MRAAYTILNRIILFQILLPCLGNLYLAELKVSGTVSKSVILNSLKSSPPQLSYAVQKSEVFQVNETFDFDQSYHDPCQASIICNVPIHRMHRRMTNADSPVKEEHGVMCDAWKDAPCEDLEKFAKLHDCFGTHVCGGCCVSSPRLPPSQSDRSMPGWVFANSITPIVCGLFFCMMACAVDTGKMKKIMSRFKRLLFGARKKRTDPMSQVNVSVMSGASADPPLKQLVAVDRDGKLRIVPQKATDSIKESVTKNTAVKKIKKIVDKTVPASSSAGVKSSNVSKPPQRSSSDTSLSTKRKSAKPALNTTKHGEDKIRAKRDAIAIAKEVRVDASQAAKKSRKKNESNTFDALDDIASQTPRSQSQGQRRKTPKSRASMRAV